MKERVLTFAKRKFAAWLEAATRDFPEAVQHGIAAMIVEGKLDDALKECSLLPKKASKGTSHAWELIARTESANQLFALLKMRYVLEHYLRDVDERLDKLCDKDVLKVIRSGPRPSSSDS